MIYSSPEFLSSCMQFLNKLRKKKQTCDISIVVNGTSYPAHKAVMLAGSPYVHQQLSRNSNCSKVLVGINILNTRVIEDVLNFLYTGEINLTDHNLAEVMLLGTYLEVTEIQTLTARFMQNSHNSAITNKKIATIEVSMDHSYNLVEEESVEINDINDEDFQIINEPTEEVPMENPTDQNFDVESPDENASEASPIKDNRSRQCSFCHKMFSSYNSCLRHTLTHTGEKPYMCELCGKSFPRKDNMLKHCGKRSCRKTLRESTMQEIDGGKKIKLDTRDDIHRALNVSEYLDPSAPPGMFVCKVCGKKSSTKPNFRRHVRIHTGIKPFQCPSCLKYFSRKDNLEGHISRWKNGACKKAVILQQESEMSENESMSESNGTKQENVTACLFSCSHCDELFESFNAFYVHSKENHDVTVEKKCPVCQLVFAEVRYLTKHLEYHKSQLKPETNTTKKKLIGYRCAACGELFMDIISFQNHDRITCTTSCRFCSKIFSSKAHLCRHIRIHFNQNLVACTLCQQACKSREKLNEHLKKDHRIEMPKYARLGRSPLVEEVTEVEMEEAVKSITTRTEKNVSDYESENDGSDF